MDVGMTGGMDGGMDGGMEGGMDGRMDGHGRSWTLMDAFHSNLIEFDVTLITLKSRGSPGTNYYLE